MRFSNIWFLIKFFRKPNFASSFISKWASSEKRLAGEAIEVLNILKIMTSADASRVTAWNIEPKVYDAYIAGIIFKTALLYRHASAKVLTPLIKRLYEFVDMRMHLPNFNEVGVGPRNIDDVIVALYVEISLKFLTLVGMNTDTNLTVFADYVLTHPNDFGESPIDRTLISDNSNAVSAPIVIPVAMTEAFRQANKIDATQVSTKCNAIGLRDIKARVNKSLYFDPTTTKLMVRENKEA